MTILDEIVRFKRIEVEKRMQARSLSELENSVQFPRKTLSISAALKNTTGIIAEFKRKSPSKGVINANADVETVTKGYAKHGAAALSILTDENFFGGSFQDIEKVRSLKIPILQKDFLIEEYQVIEAKAIGADAILLIAACLTPAQVQRLATVARSIGLEVLLELHDETEMKHLCDEISLVGINNRNLKNFAVDVEQSFRMADKLPTNKMKIAESGITSHHTVKLFREKGFDGFLIGEHFMKDRDPVKAFKKFIDALNDT